MAARLRHIALCVKDIDATADFYEKAFGMKRTKKQRGQDRLVIYMSDGEVNLALLQYKSEVGSGVPKGWTGIHHFGFQCDDLPAQQKQIEKAGGKFFFDLGEPEDDGFERKFKDPDGIVFDINWKGWQLTKDKVKNAKGGLSACDETRGGGAEESQQKDREAGQDGAQEKITHDRRLAVSGEEWHEPACAFACACWRCRPSARRRRPIRRARSR